MDGLNCNSTEMVDDNTCTHEAGCLEGIAVPAAGKWRRMTALVSVETVLLVILVVLVAGLLRSHAEILRRLGPPGSEPDFADAGVPTSAAPRRASGTPAAPIAGVTPGGDAIALDLSAPGAGDAPRLPLQRLLHLRGLLGRAGRAQLPAGVEAVVVTHGSERERPAAPAQLAADGVPVIMSSQAWIDYEVPGSPYFVLVDRVIRERGWRRHGRRSARSSATRSPRDGRLPRAVRPARRARSRSIAPSPRRGSAPSTRVCIPAPGPGRAGPMTVLAVLGCAAAAVAAVRAAWSP